MSFQDPDDREKWAKRDAEQRTKCMLSGGHVYLTTGLSADTCKNCGFADPNPKPRVVLKADSYRAVHDPKNKKVIIEQRQTDAVGGDKWEWMEDIDSESWPIYVLLVRGVRS
jgi:hypothetical protein